MADESSVKIIDLWNKERVNATSVRQEAVYRLTVESCVSEETFFRFEYNVGEKVVTVQLLRGDDGEVEGVGAEERWSVYVDGFVGGRGSSRGPFLQRNIMNQTGRDGVVGRSGLELKICVNTYRIYFVDGTEDYMRRVGSGSKYVGKEGMLDGLWKRGLGEAEVDECLKGYKVMVSG
jgi:paired amphipathic helix protein Sin3a